MPHGVLAAANAVGSLGKVAGGAGAGGAAAANGGVPYLDNALGDEELTMAKPVAQGAKKPGFFADWNEHAKNNKNQQPLMLSQIGVAPVPVLGRNGIIPQQEPNTVAQQGLLFRNYDPNQSRLPFGGAFAQGGMAPAMRRILVGENGPEEIVLPQGGQVIPNDQIQQPQTQQPSVPDPPLPTPAGGGMFRPLPDTTPARPAQVDPRYTTPIPTFGNPPGQVDPTAMQNARTVDNGAGIPAAPTEPAQAEPVEISPLEHTNLQLDRLQGTSEAPGSDPNLHHHHSAIGRLFRGIWRNYENAPNDAPLGAVLGQALVGGIADAASEKHDYNEQKGVQENKLFRQRLIQQQQADFENKQTTEQAKQANIVNEMGNRNLATHNTAINQAAQRSLDLYKSLPKYKRGEDPTLDAQLEAGGHFPDKEKDDKLQMTIAPDGRVVVLNESKGTYNVAGNDNFAKPKDFSEKDVSDQEFGILDDKAIEGAATARVAPSAKGRQVRPEIAANAPAKYKNADGSFNESAWLADLASPLGSELKASDVYQELPADDKQRVAKEADTMRKAQQQKQQYVSRFRSALNHRQPDTNANPVSLDDVKGWFKKALDSGDKNKIEEFFKILNKAQIN